MTSHHLPHALYRAAGVRELDRIAIEDHGIPGLTLMERAGAASYRLLRETWPTVGALAVICGGGNNAGDGFVVARLAHADGLQVHVVMVGAEASLKGDARSAYDAMLEAGVEAEAFAGTVPAGADVLVDALLGTGIDREVTGEWRRAIEAMNASGSPVLAIDIPSGLHADSGHVMGAAVRADLTISFIGLKAGLFTGVGRDCSGRIEFSDLNVPVTVYKDVPIAARRIDYPAMRTHLPPRGRSTHKGHYGHVLVIGGDNGYLGAARMAGEAAARTGAGLVSVATRAGHADSLAPARPELMVHGIETPAELAQLLQRATVVAIGPGLGRSDWATRLLATVLEGRWPLVLDADALNLLAEQPLRREDWVLTPHPGEAGRLLGTDTAAVQADRLAALTELQSRYGGVIVLKGSGTLIGCGNAPPALCSDGNPGLASGGTGDVLTGIVAGLLAQGFDSAVAAELGVCLHAAAADAAAAEGERGMLASDLFPHLRRLVNPMVSS